MNPRHFETRELLQYLASLSIGLFWTKNAAFKLAGKGTPETTDILSITFTCLPP